MINLKSCPVCDSYSISTYDQMGFAPHVSHEIMPGVKVDAAVITRYFVCQNCNVIFQNPRLSNFELNRFYSQGIYRRTLNLTDEEISRDEAYRARIDTEIIKRYVGKVTSHLDVGCSRGFLLDAVGAAIRVGVEPNVSDLRVKGVEIYPEMSKVPQKSFGLVTAIHVLEHEPAPLDYLKKMAEFVDKGGYLVVEVPTWKSPGGPLRLAHLFHFEPDVLKFMCAKVGLKVIQTEFTPHLILICQVASS